MPYRSDPTYQAYLAALGFDEGVARADAQRRVTQTRAAAAMTAPEVQARGEQARQAITGGFEDRGMWGSSSRLDALAGQRRAESFDLASIERQASDSVAEAEMALARELAGLGRQRLTAAASAAARAGSDGSAGIVDPLARARELMQLGRATQVRG